MAPVDVISLFGNALSYKKDKRKLDHYLTNSPCIQHLIQYST